MIIDQPFSNTFSFVAYWSKSPADLVGSVMVLSLGTKTFSPDDFLASRFLWTSETGGEKKFSYVTVD